MLLPRTGETREFTQCHDGVGVVSCVERLADYARAHGIRYIHEDRIPPGASIGLHGHTADEELYLILSGTGELGVDDARYPVGPGDIGLTREGHRHALYNTGDDDLCLYVINIKTITP